MGIFPLNFIYNVNKLKISINFALILSDIIRQNYCFMQHIYIPRKMVYLNGKDLFYSWYLYTKTTAQCLINCHCLKYICMALE